MKIGGRRKHSSFVSFRSKVGPPRMLDFGGLMIVMLMGPFGVLQFKGTASQVEDSKGTHDCHQNEADSNEREVLPPATLLLLGTITPLF
jgi:hypothetical protein